MREQNKKKVTEDDESELKLVKTPSPTEST